MTATTAVPRLPAPQGRRKGPHRTWGQRTVLVLTSVLAVAALVSAALLWDLSRLAGRIRRVPLTDVLDRAGADGEPVAPGEPQNYLLVGVDGTGGTRDDDVGGPRPVLSDSIMVLRTHPGTASADLLPLPRDLWVDIPGHGQAKVNAAMAFGSAEEPKAGGQRLLIETIRQNYGIAINHYVEIDFAGFGAVVDRVGGLGIWFPTATRDRHIGVDVAGAGCVRLDGEQALHLARSRYYDALVDGGWERDPSGDLGRIRRQQLIIRAVLTEAIDDGARNPLVLRRILDDLAGAVALDDSLQLDDLLSLAGAYRRVALQDVVTQDLSVSFGERSGQDVVLLDDSPANAAVLARFRDEPAGAGSDPASSAAPAPAPAPASVDATATTAVGSTTTSPGPTTTSAAPNAATPDPEVAADEDPLAPFTPALAAPDGTRCPA